MSPSKSEAFSLPLFFTSFVAVFLAGCAKVALGNYFDNKRSA